MSYTTWSQLSYAQISLKQTLESLLAKNNIDDALAIIRDVDLECLLKLACHSASCYRFFESADCHSLWQHHLTVFDDPSRGYIASHYHPFSVFETVLGYCFYSLSIDARRQADGRAYLPAEMSFLQKSADFFCFLAFEEYLRREIIQFSGGAFLGANSSQLIQPALRARTHHWTPGFLLATDAYFHLAQHMQHRFYFIESLTMLWVAESLSTHPQSQRAIDNAYAGHGVFSRALSPLTSWTHASETLIALGKIDHHEQSQIKQRAQVRTHQYLLQHSQDIAQENLCINNQ